MTVSHKLPLNLPIHHDAEERTAIIQVAEIRARAAQVKDRHLLVRVKGSYPGCLFRLKREAVGVGRGQDVDLWLGDDGVSRRHAQIVPENGGYAVEDNGSANGTYVQGQKVERHLLRDGDIIQFGPTAVFRYAIADEGQESLLTKLYEASISDPLTGAANREYLENKLLFEIAHAKRFNSDVSALLLDVDHFKRINDTYGHPAGDQVLVGVVQALRSQMREQDVVARYGGEEFLLLLHGLGLVQAHEVAERVRLAVEHLVVPVESAQLRVTVSIGCASLNGSEPQTRDALIGIADQRLYAAKRSGRNRVVSVD